MIESFLRKGKEVAIELFRLAESSTGKCENFAIVTDGKWQLELPSLISDEGGSELNGKSKHSISLNRF